MKIKVLNLVMKINKYKSQNRNEVLSGNNLAKYSI